MITGLIASGSIWTARSCQNLYAKEEDEEHTAQPQRNQSQEQEFESNNPGAAERSQAPGQQNRQRRRRARRKFQSHQTTSHNQKSTSLREKEACKQHRNQKSNPVDEAL